MTNAKTTMPHFFPIDFFKRTLRVAGSVTLLLLLLGVLPGVVSAQYFGQNKVNYEEYDWYYLRTEHFDVYHPKGEYEIAEFTAWTAERALQDIQKSFDWQLTSRVIFIVYPNHNAFQQTNVGGFIGESTGGFTEFLKNRVVIPFEGNYEKFRHVIHHELTHAVTLRMLYGDGLQSIVTGVSRMPVPLWLIEGLAEYESNYGWDTDSDMYIRDAIINDYLMPINRLQGYFIYKGGQSVLWYISQRYGAEKIGELMHKIRSSRDPARAFKLTLGVDLEELNKRWQRHLKREIWPTAADYEAPGDFAQQLTDHEEWYNFVNTSPALSPKGDKLVFLSNKNDYFNIYLLSTVTGEIERRLVKGSQIDLFEKLLWMRPWIGWSPDGGQIAFVAESGPEDALYTLHVESGEITRELMLGLDGIYSPTWSPDGHHIAFAGFHNGQSDIYTVDLRDTSVTRLTDDVFSDFDPNWSPDGKRLLFISDRLDFIGEPGDDFDMHNHAYHYSNVYMLDVETGGVERITEGFFHDRTPSFTPAQDTISFVSDRNGVQNLYLMSLESGDSWAITDILTGIVQPSWSREGAVAFSCFYNAGYDVFLYKDPFRPERRKELEPTAYMTMLADRHLQRTGDSLQADVSMSFPMEWHQVDTTFVVNTPTETDTAQPDTVTLKLPVEQIRESFRTTEPDSMQLGVDSLAADSDDVVIVIPRREQLTRGEMVRKDTLQVERLGTVTRQDRLTKADDDSTGGKDTSSEAMPPPEEEEEDAEITENRGAGGVRLIPDNRPGQLEDLETSAFRNHVFRPYYLEDQAREDSARMAEKEEEQGPLMTEDGEFVQKEYKLKFSPDIVNATAGYNTYFGLQGMGQIMFSDVLGNHIIYVLTDLYYSFENSNFAFYYYHLANRFDYGGGVFHNVYFFNYGEYRDRNYGISLDAIYPLDKYKRIDFSMGVVNIERDEWNWDLRDYEHKETRHFMLPTLSYVSDNTLWGWTGPMNGRRWRASFSYSPKFADDNKWGLDFKTLSFDARQYWHLGLDFVIASRLSGGASFGQDPQRFFLGGVPNWINRRFQGGDIRVDIDDIYFSSFATPLRGTDYYEKDGTRYLLYNQEFRFPLIRQMLFGWPLPLFFYNIRGALFLDAGAAWYGDNAPPGQPEGFKMFHQPYPYQGDHFRDVAVGYGWGARINLGIFLLKWDMAWENNWHSISKPKYYVSIGTDL